MKLFEERRVTVQGALVPFSDYRPFIDLPDKKVDEKTIALLIANGEERLGQAYGILKATDYMRFYRDGNRSVYEETYFARRNMVIDLLLAEYFEQKGRFTDKLIDGVWHILEESTWVVPAHMKSSENDISALTPEFGSKVELIDLFSACTGSVLAWVYRYGRDMLDKATPVIGERILYELDRRIFRPFMENDCNWWTGFSGIRVNNWNPWIVSNVLDAAALCMRDDTVRENLAGRALRMLDNFTKVYLPDGGCDEGPGYWTAAGASFFDALEILFDMTGGKINVFDVPLVRKMGEYIMNAHINGGYFLTFADAHARLAVDYAMTTRFGRRTGSGQLESFGAGGFQKNGLMRAGCSHPYRSIKDIFDCPGEPGGYACPESVWLEGIGIMAQRQFAKPEKGLYLAVKGGNNAESHNHNDVGSFIVYADGDPLLIDVGVETYRKETFLSSARYNIWTMQSAYHNLPVINGVMQKEGRQYAAKNVIYDEKARSLTMNLEDAYPAETGLKSYVRTAELLNGAITVTDEIVLNSPGDVVFNLMLSDKPDLTGEGIVSLVRGHSLTYDKSLSASVEAIELTDPKLSADWQRERLYRLRLKAEGIEKMRYETFIK